MNYDQKNSRITNMLANEEIHTTRAPPRNALPPFTENALPPFTGESIHVCTGCMVTGQKVPPLPTPPLSHPV